MLHTMVTAQRICRCAWSIGRAWVLIVLLFAVAAQGASIDNRTMDVTRRWFEANAARSPMSGAYIDERKGRLRILDEAAALLPKEIWNEYRATWNDPARAQRKRELEQTNPILYYFRQAELKALEEIRNTRVERGVQVWAMYNMGLIVKTPRTVFAIDLVQSDPDAFAEVLDFIVISHVHPDHFYNHISWKLKEKGPRFKVYGPLNVGAANEKVGQGKPYDTDEQFGDVYEYTHGDVSLRFVMSFQTVGYKTAYGTARKREPNLIARITCGQKGDGAGEGFTIIHCGDSVQGAHAKLAKDRADVDLLVCHGGLGKTGLRWLVRDVGAKLTALAHANELGHGATKWPYVVNEAARWKSFYADKIENPDEEISIHFPADRTTSLAWGERIEP